jgi:hypothetical protein
MSQPYEGDSATNNVPGIKGTNTAGGTGVWGESTNQGQGPTWIGVYGRSSSTIGGAGVYGENTVGPAIIGVSHGNGDGVYGESKDFEGVRGVSHAAWHGGVVGVNDNANTDPNNPAGPGVYGTSPGSGVVGESTGPGWFGIYGKTASNTGGAGAGGENTQNGPGVFGKSVGGAGVLGISQNGEGVHGETHSSALAAVAGISLTGTGAGIYGENKGSGPAGYFKGSVMVTGDILLANMDCAEDFNIAGCDPIEPGTVMIIDQEGALQPSQTAYDKRVAGVISGAGTLKPGIVLGKLDVQDNRMPLALVGRVYCKVDARYSPVEVGDLLTTSPTTGHAMKAHDPFKAFGAVIGKALGSLSHGEGLVPILVALQ